MTTMVSQRHDEEHNYRQAVNQIMNFVMLMAFAAMTCVIIECRIPCYIYEYLQTRTVVLMISHQSEISLSRTAQYGIVIGLSYHSST